MAITLDVNGKPLTVEAAGDTPLLWVLRDELGLTGTKYGCGIAQCGACTVLADGAPIRSCLTPVSALGSAKITTIEGLGGDLLEQSPKPTDEEIDGAMAGNICRCGAYQRIHAAIKVASGQAPADASPQTDA